MKLTRFSFIALVVASLMLVASGLLLRFAYLGGNSTERLKTAIMTSDELQIRFLEDGAESKFVRLDDSQWSEFQQILTQHYLTTEFQSMCHTPMQELRFIRNGSTILQGTLCLECTNFEITHFSFGAAWVTIGELDSESLEDLPRIRKFLTSLRLEKQSHD